MKKHISAAGIAVLLFLALTAGAATAQDSLPNFTGKWQLDVSKSDFGPMPPPDSMINVIDHKEPTIKIVTTQKGQQGESTVERTLTTDGKENVNKLRLPAGEQEVKSTSKWAGKTLTTMFKLEVQGAPLDVVDSWKLSDDGKVMTILRAIKAEQGEFAVTTVFTKQ